MKAKSIKSPDRHGTLSASSPLLPTLVSNSMSNGPVTTTNCNILPGDMCTSPLQIRLNGIQNGTPSSGPTSASLTKDTSSLECLENSMFGNISPSHTSNSSPFVRSSSSNSNSSLNLSTNCTTTSVNHAMATIINPIDNTQDDNAKTTSSPLKENYSTSDVSISKNEEGIAEVRI